MVANTLSRISNEIDGLSYEAIKLVERNRQAAIGPCEVGRQKAASKLSVIRKFLVHDSPSEVQYLQFDFKACQ